MDTLSAARRSENMRQIRSQDTKPEILVRSLLYRLGYRFRIHHADLPGKPDVVFPRLRKVVFVHGCFWHQHARCIDGRLPQSRTSYWVPKLLANKRRDAVNRRMLRRMGWRSLVVWECQTADIHKLEALLVRFLEG